MRRFRNRVMALVCTVCVLHLMAFDFVYALTNPGYSGMTVSGRVSLAMVSGGASGIRVNTFTGNLFLPRTDLAIPARGLPVEVKRAYNSDDHGIPGPFGYGWQFGYGLSYVRLPDGGVIITWGDGRTDLFTLSGGTYTPVNEGVFTTLEQYRPDQFRVTAKEGIQYYFDNPIHRHLTRIVDPDGNTLAFTYDSNLQLTKITDTSGRSLYLSYTNGKVTAITDPNASPARTLQYTYDANGNQVGFTDPLGNVTKYVYDGAHRLTRIADPLGITDISYTAPDFTVGTINRTSLTGTLLRQKSFAFNSVMKTASVADRLDSTHIAVTRYRYDANNRLSSITDPLGHTVTRTYDDAGNIASITDANSNTTQYSYDSRGNVLTITDPRGKTTSLTYEDTFNRITSVTDPNNHTMVFDYDSRGHLTSLRDPLANTTEYSYDSFGQLLSRLNPRGFTTRFTYDAFGNRTSITDPLNHTTSFTYDGVGNLRSRTDAKNKTIVYSHDAWNRLSNVSFPDATQATFTYDPLGNMLSAADPNTNRTFAYDANGRLLQANDNLLSKAITYQYDGVGNRVRMTDPEGAVTTYSHDLASRLTRIVRNSQQFLFNYDNGDRRTRLTLPNGSFTVYGYDEANELLSLVNKKSNGSVISSFTYQYDAAGKRIRLNQTGGDQIVYDYDDRDQLTREIRTGGASNYDHRFAYDTAGNRTQADTDGVITTYAYNNGDQLTQETTGATTTTYAYDPNGNQIQKAIGASTFTSSYDVRDRLIQFSSPTMTAQYAYDVLDRRIAKSVGGTTTRFVYDGLDAVAEYDGSGALKAQNLFGPDKDENLARFTGAGSLYYLHDGLNSVRNLVDGTQTVRNSYGYDAWGKFVSRAETVANDYTFTGRQADRESGLYYFRARMYDPSNGRFTRVDPINDNTGRSPYIYVDNNPVSLFDPLGLWDWPSWSDVGKVAAVVVLVGAIVFAPEIAAVAPEVGEVVAELIEAGAETGEVEEGIAEAEEGLKAEEGLTGGPAAFVFLTPNKGDSSNPGGHNRGRERGKNAPGGDEHKNPFGKQGDDSKAATAAGGGSFLGPNGVKNIPVFAISSLVAMTSPNSFAIASDINGSLSVYNYGTRTLINAVSFSSMQGSFSGDDLNVSVTGKAMVNGTLTNFTFNAAWTAGVPTFEMRNADTGALLASGTGESGRSTVSLRVGF